MKSLFSQISAAMPARNHRGTRLFIGAYRCHLHSALLKEIVRFALVFVVIAGRTPRIISFTAATALESQLRRQQEYWYQVIAYR